MLCSTGTGSVDVRSIFKSRAFLEEKDSCTLFQKVSMELTKLFSTFTISELQDLESFFFLMFFRRGRADPEISLGSVELKVSDARVKKGSEGESQVERVAWVPSAYIMQSPDAGRSR